MGLQEGLLLLGGLVFLLILLDALRRKRAAARCQEEDEDPEEQHKKAQIARELPNLDDPAIKKKRQELDPLFDDIDIFDDDPIPVLRKSAQLDQPHSGTPEPAGSDAPMTTEQVRRLFERDPGFTAASHRYAQSLQQSAPYDEPVQDELADPQTLEQVPEHLPQEVEEYEHPLAAEEHLHPEHIDDLDQRIDFESQQPEPEHPSYEAQAPEPSDASEIVQQPAIDQYEREQKAAQLLQLEQQAWGDAEEFLTININARPDRPFEGYKLAYLMDMIGMQLSSSGFYHFVVEPKGQSALGYSMVNMYTPGRFDEKQMDHFATSGVVLVMALPNARKSLAVFERMLETARVFERNWEAELQDEQRSNLTLQTIEHYRQRIQEFERKTRLKEIKAQKASK